MNNQKSLDIMRMLEAYLSPDEIIKWNELSNPNIDEDQRLIFAEEMLNKYSANNLEE